METPARPLSSKPISSIPMTIDESYSVLGSGWGARAGLRENSTYGMKLNTLVQQLPKFGVKSNTSVMLYSKFVVKGLKQEKIHVVRSGIRRKEEPADTATLETRDGRSKSVRGAALENFIMNDRDEDISVIDDNTKNFKTAVMGRSSSAKGFKKSYAKDQIGQSERGLKKNSTEANLHVVPERRRPTTAKVTHSTEARNIQIETHRNNSQVRKQRPATAKGQKFRPSIPVNYYDYTDSIESKTFIKQKLRKVESTKLINHVQKNISNVSSYTKKASSIYLTSFNIQNLLSGRKGEVARKLETTPESKQKKIQIAEETQVKPQQVWGWEDKKEHEGRVKQVQSYLASSMPTKFHIVAEQLKRQQRKHKVVDDSYQQLLSIDLDNHYEEKHPKIDEKSARECYEDYIKNCQFLQFQIHDKFKQQPKNVVSPTLSVWQCQQLLQIYQKMNQAQPKSCLDFCKTRIIQIVSNLKYFSHKPRAQIQRLFSIPFTIEQVEQNQNIADFINKIKHVHIVLNGSVIVQSRIPAIHDKYTGLTQSEPLQSSFTLFDGDSFGEPSHKTNNLNIRTLEKTLLMKIKIADYVSVFCQGSEVVQKMSVLKKSFARELEGGLLKQEDIEIICLALEKVSFPARSLVFRQGQIFDKLVFVARGKCYASNEFILEKQKVKPLDVKQQDKNVREASKKHEKQHSKSSKFVKLTEQQVGVYPQNLRIQHMRRENLINYQIVRQDRKKIYYYQIKQLATFVKADSLNWQAFRDCIPTVQSRQEEQDELPPKASLASQQIEAVSYSLMSGQDDTEVYLLSRGAYNYLPIEIKKVLYARSQEKSRSSVKIQSQKDIKQWNRFKDSLCEQIVAQKKARSNNKRF